jgi:peroxiredoxin
LPDLVAPLLFRIRHLSVGKPAPEITGTDAEGRSFKLSDFRGRVVVLDFFADWCPYCARMYAEEGALVKKYAGRPFALLGINGDGPDTLQQLVEQKKVTRRCWSDGRGGPIAQAWQVEVYPTLYVIDRDGIIRQVLSGAPRPGALEQAIIPWLDVAEVAAKGPGIPAGAAKDLAKRP